MSQSTQLTFESPWALLLAVILPLVIIALFASERRKAKPLQAEAGSGIQPLRVLLLGSAVLLLTGLAVGVLAILTAPAPLSSHPLFFVALGALAGAVLLAAGASWIKRRQRPVWMVPTIGWMSLLPQGQPSPLRFLVPLLRLSAVVLLVIAIARPQIASTETDVFTEGMDIVLVLDLSTTMRAVDFAPPERLGERTSRIEGAKEVIGNFIHQRKNDRIGLVVFAREAFTQCPLTLDYSVIQNIVRSVQTGVIEDGTAIGNALMIAVNRLRDSEVKSKVIILLTDGDDNASTIAPMQAAEVARSLGIKIFPILVGKGGLVPYPVGADLFGRQQFQQVEIRTNPELLKGIAGKAHGKFYQATDQGTLATDFRDILDQMEKSRLMDPGRFTRHTEMFHLALLPALLCLLLEMLLGWTRFRTFP